MSYGWEALKMNTLIVSAGKNTRFGEEKSLKKIFGLENIIRTHNIFKRFSRNVYIVVRRDALHKYLKVFPEGNYITVNKSEGEGQAVRDALRQLPQAVYIITWGDMVFRNDKFMDPFLRQVETGRLNILTSYDNKPKMSYIVDEHNHVTVPLHPGKRDFEIPRGISDKGVFLARKDVLMHYLKKLKPNEDGEYKLLETTKQMYKDKHGAKAVIVKDPRIYTYNTHKELEAIVKNERRKITFGKHLHTVMGKRRTLRNPNKKY